ncbi:MAG: tyrosine-type recombinase/integrase, partial [Kofleriaceae bacterium]|nr:tyrosine-type recombinase/integrase [Kofleriaceae bacterium]
PLSYWAVRDGIHAIYDRAGVKPGLIWHGLRHAYCSRLAAEGVPINVIKELAGHKSIETTLRYMHTSLNAKRDAIRMAFGSSGQQVANSPIRKSEKPSN